MDNGIKEAKGLGFKSLSRLYQNYLKKAIDGGETTPVQSHPRLRGYIFPKVLFSFPSQMGSDGKKKKEGGRVEVFCSMLEMARRVALAGFTSLTFSSTHASSL